MVPESQRLARRSQRSAQASGVISVRWRRGSPLAAHNDERARARATINRASRGGKYRIAKGPDAMSGHSQN